MSAKTRHELDDEKDERIMEIMEEYAPVFEAYFAEQKKRINEAHRNRLLEIERMWEEKQGKKNEQRSSRTHKNPMEQKPETGV